MARPAIATELARLNKDGSSISSPTVSQQFFNVDALKDNGIAHLLQGEALVIAQAFATRVIDDLNFFLTSSRGVTGFSLPALNILRGRDRRLASWLHTRAAVVGDVDPATVDLNDFSAITSDAVTQAELRAAYGTIDQVDLWVGGLAEDKIAGTQMGVTVTAIMADQFSRTRSADETFGVLDPLVAAEIAAEVAKTTLADVVQRNSTIEQDVFQAMNRVAGDDTADRMLTSLAADLVLGFDGDDMLHGRPGDDELHGDADDDYLRGGRGDDWLFGGTGGNTLQGHGGNDTLDGGASDDILRGHAGDDSLSGGAGNDNLNGGLGNDRANGDAGADTFIFATGYDFDTIMDFRSGEDEVDLSGTSVADFAELIGLSNEARNRVTFEIGDDVLVLRKLGLADLDEADFVFA
ncbi:MAG: peroxidase family protein [Pseudomonadota bacterium]